MLALAGWALVRLLAPLRSGVGVAWRYGLANIARRGRDSVVQIVAFGLGFMVLLLLALVRDDLLRDWRRSLPADAPNYFMINIRPDEGADLQGFLRQAGLPATELVPMLRARLVAINDTPVEQMTFERRPRQRFRRARSEPHLVGRHPDPATRSSRDEWWPAGELDQPQVSVEVEYAARLGLKLGDSLTYDIAGEAVTGRISSLREVRWDTFKPNFFVVFSPGVLETATGTLITSVHVAPEQRPVLVDLVPPLPRSHDHRHRRPCWRRCAT